MTRAERAAAIHASGSSCAQAVFAAFAEDLGLDEGTAQRIASGLGAGYGRLQLTCGAVSGGVLALGLALGNARGEEQDRKEAAYAASRELALAAAAEFGASDCRALLRGADLRTEEGKARVKAEGLSDLVCKPIVGRCVELVEERLAAAGLIRQAPAGGLGAAGLGVDGPGGSGGRSLPEGLAIEAAGAAEAGILGEFRARMFAEMDKANAEEAVRAAVASGAAEYFRRKAGAADQVNLVARLGGKVVGCAAMILEERPARPGEGRPMGGFVHNVYVLPEARGKGVARALMERLRAEAEARGVSRMSLRASAAGRPLYLGLGWAQNPKDLELKLK